MPIAGSARKEANVWETMVAIMGFSIGALLVCGAVFDFPCSDLRYHDRRADHVGRPFLSVWTFGHVNPMR